MRALVALALILALLVTVFAVQNNADTTVKFLAWSVRGSAALVLMITLIVGIVVGLLLMIPGSVRNRLKVAELNRQVKSLDRDLQDARAGLPKPSGTMAETPGSGSD
ncbi:MAG TPA: LapA family protein [Anaerolineales bacterium]